MTTLELCAKLDSIDAGEVATLFFKDGEIIRGGMLYNSTQQRGVIIDPGTETQRRFEANEVAKVWRR
jgi:trehalose utilization protein